MPFFKNHKQSGLTIIEVMLAVALVSILSLGVLALQQTLMKTTSTASNLLYHMRILNNFVADSHKDFLEDKEPQPAVKDEADVQLAVSKKELKPLDVFKNIKEVVILKFDISWQELMGKREEKFVTLSYEPSGEKEKSS